MDVDAFLSSLLDALSGRSFVESVDLQTEAVIVKGRVILNDERFLQVYFNEHTGTTAFALIEDEQRVWGWITIPCGAGTCIPLTVRTIIGTSIR
jgi:hypothetical protein